MDRPISFDFDASPFADAASELTELLTPEFLGRIPEALYHSILDLVSAGKSLADFAQIEYGPAAIGTIGGTATVKPSSRLISLLTALRAFKEHS